MRISEYLLEREDLNIGERGPEWRQGGEADYTHGVFSASSAETDFEKLRTVAG